MRHFLALVAVLSLALPSQAQSVKLPAEVKGDPGAWIVVVPESKEGGEVKWKMGPGLTQVRLDLLFPGQKSAGIVVQAQKGRYEVWAWNAKDSVASDLAVCVVVVGEAPPVPPGPVPPGPVPPGPGPTPSPTPIPEAGFHALVVYESMDKMPPLQGAILIGTDVRNYLKSKNPDGYRFLDKDADVSDAPKWIKDAMARPRVSLPWLLISAGATGPGYEGPLPNDIPATLELLKKIGG